MNLYERRVLRKMARSRKIKAGDPRRARVILRLAKGESYQSIMLLEGCGSEFITRCRKRFEAERLAGLYVRHRGRIVSDNVLSLEAQILSATQQPLADGSTHWTTRKLARQLGVSHSRVARVWAQAGIQPHRLRRYMASNDPEFEEKALDIIGLYKKPPLNAAVFCVDEKSAIQALDRLDPVLPLNFSTRLIPYSMGRFPSTSLNFTHMRSMSPQSSLPKKPESSRPNRIDKILLTKHRIFKPNDLSDFHADTRRLQRAPHRCRTALNAVLSKERF